MAAKYTTESTLWQAEELIILGATLILKNHMNTAVPGCALQEIHSSAFHLYACDQFPSAKDSGPFTI